MKNKQTKNRKDEGQQITQVQNQFSEKSFLITNFIQYRETEIFKGNTNQY